MKTARMLAPGAGPRFEQFPELVAQLVEILQNRDFEPRVTPPIQSPPPVWMLGSSPESAMLAARLGLPYNFALFINSNIDPRILEFYRHYFEPSAQSSQPRGLHRDQRHLRRHRGGGQTPRTQPRSALRPLRFGQAQQRRTCRGGS